MPEIYGAFEGDADTQFVGCITCGNTIDIYETHPMFREESVSEVGDVVVQTYHFCSDSCLQRWKRERDIGE